MELDQSGYLSKKKFRIKFSRSYKRLHNEAKEQAKNMIWSLLADRGRTFPLVVQEVSEINLNKSTSADIGTLIKYFSYRDKSINEILRNIKWEEIKDKK